MENARVKRRRIIFIIAILLLASLIATQLTYSLPSTQVTISSSFSIKSSSQSSGFYPPLHVSGKYIEDSHNNVVLLKGWDKNGFEDSPQGSWLDETGAYSYGSFNNATVTTNLEAMKADGANFVRVVSVSQYALNANDLKYICQLAQLCAAQQIYMCYALCANNATEPGFPIGCPFQDPNSNNGFINTPADFINMWGNTSSTFKNYPNVLFELWGEPSCSSETLWFSSCTKLHK